MIDSLIQIDKLSEADSCCNVISEQAWNAGIYKSWTTARIYTARISRRLDASNGKKTALNNLLLDLEKAKVNCPEHIGVLAFHVAYSYRSLNNYNTSGKYYEIARKIHESGNSVTIESGRYLYKPLANIYTRLGETEKAILLLHRGLDTCLFNEQYDQVPNLYSDLGVAYLTNKENKEAYAALLKGIEYISKYPPEAQKRYTILSILHANLSNLALMNGNISESDSLIHLALQYDNQNMAALENAAQLAALKGEYPKADNLLKEVQSILESTPLPYNRELGKVLLQRSEVANARKNNLQALQLSNEALQTVLPEFAPENIFSNPYPTQFYPENTILEALNAKSEIAWAQYEREHDDKWLQLADQCTSLALQMNDTLIAAFGYTSSKLLSLEQSRELYERYLTILFEQKTKGAPGASEAIFAFAERSKSMLLRQHLAENKAIRQLPKALAERDATLRHQINSLREEYTLALAEDAEETQLKSIKRAIFDAENGHQRFLDSLEQRYPAFYQASRAPVKANLAEVQAWLPPSALLLSWFYNPESGTLFLIGVDKKGISTRLETLDSRRLEAFLALISNPQLNLEMEGDTGFVRSYAVEAQYLYDKLIRPIAGNTPPEELIVIPDGILGSIPLDALLPSPPSTLSFRRLPWLLHQSRCRFAPSASFLMESPDRQEPYDIGYLGIAPGYQGDSTFASISYNINCVETLCKSLQGKKYIGQEATKTICRKGLEQCQVLHFYGHGQANSENPEASFLVFASNTGSPIASNLIQEKTHNLRPGLLAYNKPLPAAEAPRVWFAEEIGQQPLRAQLVLLSACETGLGKAAGTEGILSLSRAFQDAGVPSTVMTLWSVDDQATAQLSVALLQKLRAGDMRKDEALRQSKLQYLQSGAAAAPFFWAGMVLTGDATPLKIQKSPTTIKLAGKEYSLVALGLCTALLALIALLFYRIWSK